MTNGLIGLMAFAQEAAADAAAPPPAKWFNEDLWFSAFIIVLVGVALYVFIARMKKDPTKVCDTDDPAALAEAAKRGEVVQCFGEISKVKDDPEGGLTVNFRASKKDQAFVVFVAKDKKEAFKALELGAAAEEFRQNYLWFETKVTADPKGYFKAESSDPAKWKRAGPEPVIPK